MTNFTMIDPTRIFEINGQVCPLLNYPAAIAVGNNRQMVAAASGKRHRVMGWKAQGDTGVSSMALKSASGGTFLTTALTMPSNAAGSFDFLPIVACGYMETLTGEGLFVDVATNVLLINLWYVTYKL